MFHSFCLLFATVALPNPCSLADLSKITDEDCSRHIDFHVRGTVLSLARTNNFILGDSHGRTQIWYSKDIPRVGDVLDVNGHTACENHGLGYFKAESISKIGTSEVPRPVLATPADLHEGKLDFAVIQLRGFVVDATTDEIDPAWSYLVIRCGNSTAYAFILNKGNDLEPFINAEVELTGICIPKHGGLRVFIGPHVELRDFSDIVIITPAPANPFDAPLLKSIHHVSAASVATMGRQRAIGQVVAVWQDNRFLMETHDHRIIGVETASGSSLPNCFMHIEVVGHPQTDLYRINLSQAKWRPMRDQSDLSRFTNPETPVVLDLNGPISPTFWPESHGRLLRIVGTVRNMPARGNSIGQINLDCGNYLVPIDISSCPEVVNELAIGSRIRVDGICVLDIPDWQANAAFPRIRSFFVVIRQMSDITVLERPSWWTPGRLLAVIGFLFAALVGILIWSVSLRRIAERRGRELFKAEIGKVGAELRIDERTRLAVELHDSIAQNLTAISFQVASAMNSRAVAPDASARHLENADRMLHSCRTELRRCLWDLRSDTLEEPDFAKAIQTTVSEVLGDATAHIRFTVPRAHVSDTTAHTVLNIIRELTSNAVRHGNAQNVWIAGEADHRQLRFSVRDDGCGFDAAAAPGEESGHFGLKGIHERLKPLDGTLQLSSDSRGTRAIVTIHLQSSQNETNE